jgi:hypothetical protein
MRQRFIWLIIIIIAASGFLLWRIHQKNQQTKNLTESIDRQQGTGPGSPNSSGQDPVLSNNPELPKTLLLKVPFTPQAPTANWDELHNEACEEASSLMAGAYFAGNHNDTIPAAEAESEIAKLVQWEQNNLGYHLDTTSPETTKMIEANYGLKTKLLENFTISDLKRELNQDHLIIISVDGRLLGNPNFRQPGPPHHMLVIKGYTSESIVTNDPGTRKGFNYSYSFATIYNAAGDWSQGISAVDRSNKVALIVWKE